MLGEQAITSVGFLFGALYFWTCDKTKQSLVYNIWKSYYELPDIFFTYLSLEG